MLPVIGVDAFLDGADKPKIRAVFRVDYLRLESEDTFNFSFVTNNFVKVTPLENSKQLFLSFLFDFKIWELR